MNANQRRFVSGNDSKAEQAERVVRFSRNKRGRDFVIGDIHGTFDLVLAAMEQAGFNPDIDRLFSVGDLIDRGNGSHRCAAFLAKPYVHSVRGNHEDMLIDLYAEGTPSPEVLRVAARYNGFNWWLDLPETERQKILAAIRKLPLAIEIETDRGTVGVIHADVPLGMAWCEFLGMLNVGDPAVIKTCLWGRDRLRLGDMTGVHGVGRLFVGHTPQWGNLTRAGNVYALDTGAVFGQTGIKEEGHLTMAQVMTRTEVLTAPHRKPGLVNLFDEAVPPDGSFGQYATKAA